jgi:peptide/nickel transport system substrate-binding protein
MWVNPNVPPFSDPKVRAALATAIDREAIIEQVYGETGDVATQIFPIGALPEGEGTFTPTVDQGPLKALVPSLATKKVDLAFTTDDALNAQVAQLVQAQLAPTGLQVTTRGVTQQTTYAWPTKPDGRPNALILPANPDSTDPSSFAGLFYAKTGGLSYFAPKNVARADSLLQEGLYAPSDAASKAAFKAAADEYIASGNYIPLADLKAVFVARKGICGWEQAHNFATLWAFRPQGLTAC